MLSLPRYVTLKIIQARIAPISRKQLNSWVIAGHVRSVKLGESRQAGRLYNSQDVVDALDRLAVGRLPRVRRRVR